MSTINANYTQQNLYSPITSSTREQNSLSDSQKDSIKDILSNYDASSLTSDDASEIVELFKELGVNPSQEMASYLDELGFDAAQIGQLSQDSSSTSTSMAKGSMPPPPPPPQVQDELSQTLSELYSEDEDETTTTSTNPYASSDTSTSFSNLLDYTSRILSLNEDSQQEVLDMFENYNNSDDKSSQADSVRASLSQILSNQNNYSSLSLYA